MVRAVNPSFAKGELSPELYGRVDVAAYDIGLSLARNVAIKTFGGAAKRPGLRYLAPVKDHSYAPQLIEFQFKTTDTYILEFGDKYMRVMRNDGHVTTNSTSISNISNSNPAVITTSTPHGWSNGTEVYIEDAGGMIQLEQGRFIVKNVTSNTMELTHQVTGANVNSIEYAAYTSGGTVGEVYEIVTPYAKEDLPELTFTQSADVMTLTHRSYDIRELKRFDHDNWVLDPLDLGPKIAFPRGLRRQTGAAGDERYRVTAINADNEESLPAISNSSKNITGITQANPCRITSPAHGYVAGDEVYLENIVGMTELNNNRYIVSNTDADNFDLTNIDGAAIDSTNFGSYVSGGNIYDTYVTQNITTGIIEWNAVAGAARYAVYRTEAGIYGLIGETTALEFTDATINPDTSETPPRFRNPFQGENDKPQAVGYYEQRRVFGGSNNEPDTTQYSQTGNQSNFNQSQPLRSDDAFAATLTSLQVNEIRHFVPMNDLLVFTSGSEWRVSAGDDSGFEITTIRQKPQTTWGSSYIRPIVTNNTVLYIPDDLTRVRSFGYSLTLDGYTGADVTILSTHFFKGHQIMDWSNIHVPDSRFHVVRDDGVLLALAFDQEQEVTAWSSWDTEGCFEKTASLRKGGRFQEDSTYFVIKRTVGGRDVRYIEVARDEYFESSKDAFFVDCGLRGQSETPITKVYGLGHVEGETVQLVGDGNLFPEQTVVNGSVTFPRGVTHFTVGLAYTMEITTLDMEFATRTVSTIQSRRTVRPEVTSRFYKTLEFEVRNSKEDWIEGKIREYEDFGDPTECVCGDITTKIGGAYDDENRIYYRSMKPFPFTLLAIIPTFHIGDAD